MWTGSQHSLQLDSSQQSAPPLLQASCLPRNSAIQDTDHISAWVPSLQASQEIAEQRLPGTASPPCKPRRMSAATDGGGSPGTRTPPRVAVGPGRTRAPSPGPSRAGGADRVHSAELLMAKADSGELHAASPRSNADMSDAKTAALAALLQVCMVGLYQDGWVLICT